MKGIQYTKLFRCILGLEEYSDTVWHYRNLQNIRFAFPLILLDIIYIFNIHYVVKIQTGTSVVHNCYHYLQLLFYIVVAIMLCFFRKHQKKYEHVISLFIDCFIAIRLMLSFRLALEMEQTFYMLPFYISSLWCFALLNIKPLYTIVLIVAIYINLKFFNNDNMHVLFFIKSRFIIASLVIISFAKYHNFLYTSRLHEQLYYLSRTDELSGVQNRHALQENYHKYTGKTLLILMADIDDFKSINDTYGHVRGDGVIRDYAEVITDVFKKGDCYRFGGDEFLIIIEYEETLTHLLTEYAKKTKQLRIAHTNIAPHFSLGYVCGLCEVLEDVQRMIIKADERLYQAKKEGKDKIIGDFI